MIKKVKIIASALASSGIALVTNKASAAVTIPGTVQQNVDIDQVISNILAVAVWIAGLLSVFFIIYGGIQYITAGASKDGVTKAKTTLIYAIVGIIVVVLGVSIRNFVLSRLGAGSGANLVAP